MYYKHMMHTGRRINMAFEERYQVSQVTNGSKIYILNKKNLNTFLKELNDYSELSTLFTDFSQYVISLRVYPISFIGIGTAVSNPWKIALNPTPSGPADIIFKTKIQIGNKRFKGAQAATRIENDYSLAEFETTRIYIDLLFPDYTWLKWTSYKPFVTAQLYLPMYGYVDIDINSIMERYIQLRYFVDIGTGMCNVYVLSYPSSTGNDGERLELIKSYKLGVDCPWSTSNKDMVERERLFIAIKDVFTEWPAAVVGGAMTGGVAGAIMQGAKATGDTIEEVLRVTPGLLKGGSYEGNWLQTTMDFTPHIMLAYKQPVILDDLPYKNIKGISVFEPVDNLQNTGGYTVMTNVHVRNSGVMFDTEVEELTQLLTSGVILP